MCGLYILLGPWPSRSSVNTVHQRPCRQIRGGSRVDRLEVNLHMEPGRSFLWRCYRHLPAVGCYHRERLVLTGRMSVWYQYLVLTPLFCNGVCQGSDQSKWRTISLFQTFKKYIWIRHREPREIPTCCLCHIVFIKSRWEILCSLVDSLEIEKGEEGHSAFD